MINKVQWDIASKYIKSKRKESFVSFVSNFALIGIALGVGVLIIVMSVMNGFRKEIVSGIIGINGHIAIYGYNGITNYNNYIDNIKQNDNIYTISPSIESQVLFSSNTASLGGMIYGLTYGDLITREPIFKNIKNINLNTYEKNEAVILIGRIVARSLNVSINDTITIVTPNGYTTAVGSIPKFASFKIIGIIDTGMYQYDSALGVIPFPLAQDFFNYINKAEKIDIFLKNPQKANEIKQDIVPFLDSNLHINTWEDNNSYLIKALSTERNVMFLILSLVILIATFNIVSGLVMLVRSKTKEIAILQAMGLSKKSIITIFLLIGLRIGLLGTAIGCALGILISIYLDNIKKVLDYLTGSNLFSEEIYFLSKLPSDLQMTQVLLVIILSLVFTIISSIYPAIRASSVTIVEGLKYD